MATGGWQARKTFDWEEARKCLAIVGELRPLPNAPGYAATCDGRIISMQRWKQNKNAIARVLRPMRDVGDYEQVNVRFVTGWRRVRVHKLVAAVFLPPPAPGQRGLIHIDGNRANSRVDNLAWGSQLEIMQAAQRRGTTCRGEGQRAARLNDDAVIQLRRLHARGVSIRRLAWQMGVARRTIWDVLNGRSWIWLKDQHGRSNGHDGAGGRAERHGELRGVVAAPEAVLDSAND